VSCDWLQRQKLCEKLIEGDNKFRQSAGLSTPSLDDIRAMKRVKLVTGANRKALLLRLGVLERRRPTYVKRDHDRGRGRGRGRGSSRGGYDRRRRSVVLTLQMTFGRGAGSGCGEVAEAIAFSALNEEWQYPPNFVSWSIAY